MKKFVLKVLLFFACVVLMDIVFGFVFSWLRSHAKGGSTANCEYIANRANEDIIILGSSRATHHYIPQIIEDSLRLSCYNCGEEGNGVVLAYGRLKMLTNRYKPKLILYEITPGYDYGTLEPNNKYLGYLRAYYDKKSVREIFDDFDDDLSRLKMKSKMYQNAGRLLPDVYDNIFIRNNHKGYEPLYGHLDSLSCLPTTNKTHNMIIDTLKLIYVEKIIKEAKNNNIPIVFMISPLFNYKGNMSEYFPAINICKKYSVPIVNNINESRLNNNYGLFQDNYHLNEQGAKVYTQFVVQQIREIVDSY